MRGLKGKNALITGASSGIGQAIAIYLAQKGCNIAIHYHELFIDGGLTLYADFREAWSA